MLYGSSNDDDRGIHPPPLPAVVPSLRSVRVTTACGSSRSCSHSCSSSSSSSSDVTTTTKMITSSANANIRTRTTRIRTRSLRYLVAAALIHFVAVALSSYSTSAVAKVTAAGASPLPSSCGDNRGPERTGRGMAFILLPSSRPPRGPLLQRQRQQQQQPQRRKTTHRTEEKNAIPLDAVSCIPTTASRRRRGTVLQPLYASSSAAPTTTVPTTSTPTPTPTTNDGDGGDTVVGTSSSSLDTNDVSGTSSKNKNGDEDDGDHENHNKEEEMATTATTTTTTDNIFEQVAYFAGKCLSESDLKRDAIGKQAGKQASSSSNWIDDASAFALQKSIDQMRLKMPAEFAPGRDADQAVTWLRWLKTIPSPAVVDLSSEFRTAVSATVADRSLERIYVRSSSSSSGSNDNGPSSSSTGTMATIRTQFLNRVVCRLIIMPSGSVLTSPLVEPPSSLVFGKLLYGGATRYRLLHSSTGGNRARPPRRTGERTELKTHVARDSVPAWIQYGGPRRYYEAVDMGSCAVLEIALLPRVQNIEVSVDEKDSTATGAVGAPNMWIGNFPWKPTSMFTYYVKGEDVDGGSSTTGSPTTATGSATTAPSPSGESASSLAGKDRNDAFRAEFSTRVGGLQKEIDTIVRRVLDGRVLKPADDDSRTTTASSSSSSGIDGMVDKSAQQLSTASLEAEELAALGLTPVKGLLLYGPPGCGKTALIREIAKALRARKPKIVAAPELLDRWVGGSEKMVRELFADAEAELAACNGDVTKSALHVIVIDEIDAVFRKRSSAEDSGEATRSSVVNQILTKLDGINSIPNVLFIGMTNRRELLDDALLRPGRLEVQIEIPLPDKEGRREILQIHFDALRKRGRLSQPLCDAIDGRQIQRTKEENSPMPAPDEFSDGRGSKRKAFKKAIKRVLDMSQSTIVGAATGGRSNRYDLAADYATAGFSGADIAGLVRCAGSLALARSRRDGSGVDGLLITLEDVKQALQEVKR